MGSDRSEICSADFMERQVLGVVLEDPKTWETVATLHKDDFLLDSHRRIFACMTELADLGIPIDLPILADRLEEHGELEKIGGPAYLVATVHASAQRRRYKRGAEMLSRLASDGTVSPDTLRAATLATMETLADSSNATPPRFSEEAIALRFSQQYESELRYVSRWRQWLRWEGTRWAEDETLHVFDLARGLCRQVSAECGEIEKITAIRFASKATSAAIEVLARADRRHAATVEQWDRDTLLLNTPAGTVDLRNGTLYQHLREDYLTKITAASPGAGCSLWL
jgi:hypothetical protein